jgi:hypothetical protein
MAGTLGRYDTRSLKALANQTSRATEDIADQISEIQSAARMKSIPSRREFLSSRKSLPTSRPPSTNKAGPRSRSAAECKLRRIKRRLPQARSKPARPRSTKVRWPRLRFLNGPNCCRRAPMILMTTTLYHHIFTAGGSARTEGGLGQNLRLQLRCQTANGWITVRESCVIVPHIGSGFVGQEAGAPLRRSRRLNQARCGSGADAISRSSCRRPTTAACGRCAAPRSDHAGLAALADRAILRISRIQGP